MINSSFQSYGINSISSSGSNGPAILQPADNPNIVVCEGHMFDRQILLNSEYDMIKACQLGIANKIWNKVPLYKSNAVTKGNTEGDSIDNKPIHYIEKKSDINDTNCAIYGKGSYAKTTTETGYYYKAVMIYDIGPKFIKFIYVSFPDLVDDISKINDTNPFATHYTNSDGFGWSAFRINTMLYEFYDQFKHFEHDKWFFEMGESSPQYIENIHIYNGFSAPSSAEIYYRDTMSSNVTTITAEKVNDPRTLHSN